MNGHPVRVGGYPADIKVGLLVSTELLSILSRLDMPVHVGGEVQIVDEDWKPYPTPLEYLYGSTTIGVSGDVREGEDVEILDLSSWDGFELVRRSLDSTSVYCSERFVSLCRREGWGFHFYSVDTTEPSGTPAGVWFHTKDKLWPPKQLEHLFS